MIHYFFKEISYLIQTSPTQNVKVYFFFKVRFLTDFLKIIGTQNQLLITF